MFAEELGKSASLPALTIQDKSMQIARCAGSWPAQPDFPVPDPGQELLSPHLVAPI
jgi:hypothetical protein